MRRNKRGFPYNALDAVKSAYPEEYKTAKSLPEDVFNALYPYAFLGPAFPEILEMYDELKAIRERAEAGDEETKDSIFLFYSRLFSDFLPAKPTRMSTSQYDSPYHVMRCYWMPFREYREKHYKEARTRFGGYSLKTLKKPLYHIAYILSASLAVMKCDYSDSPKNDATRILEEWERFKSSNQIEATPSIGGVR